MFSYLFIAATYVVHPGHRRSYRAIFCIPATLLYSSTSHQNISQPTTLASITMSDSRDLNEDEIADLKEAFSMFDINGDGEWIEIESRENERERRIFSVTWHVVEMPVSRHALSRFVLVGGNFQQEEIGRSGMEANTTLADDRVQIDYINDEL